MKFKLFHDYLNEVNDYLNEVAQTQKDKYRMFSAAHI